MLISLPIFGLMCNLDITVILEYLWSHFENVLILGSLIRTVSAILCYVRDLCLNQAAPVIV
jgi:hypothetical protein